MNSETINKVYEESVDENHYYARGTSNTYDLGDNTYVRNSFSRQNYEEFRPSERTPNNPENNIRLALLAYDKVGIFKNIVDLMSELTIKGMKIYHPDEKQQKFYREWWSYVKGQLVSERFTNYMYRIGNIPIAISYGKVPVKTETKWSSSYATDDVVSNIFTSYRRIPLRYGFVNPTCLEVISPELSMFTGNTTYAYRLTYSVINAIKNIKNHFPDMNDTEINKIVPQVFIDAARKGKTLVPIDKEKLRIYHYKKDDWLNWANPIVSSIFDDLMELEKMKLADISALDGAISAVRLWKLGHLNDNNPNLSIIPNPNAFKKLRNILAQCASGGTTDIFWGPDIELKESTSDVHKFLGMAKYEPVLTNIYDGLGVPFSVGKDSGLNNAYMKIQIFTERLEFGRVVLLDFWKSQFNEIAQAMGYDKPPIIEFDQINLGDDVAYKKFLLDLVDRDIIPEEILRDTCKFSSTIHEQKLKKQSRKRKSGKIPTKVSPFHSANTESDLKKIALQSGMVTPSEVGLELDDKKPGEVSSREFQSNTGIIPTAKPKKNNGRPSGVKDSEPRAKKTTPLYTKGHDVINLVLWADDTQNKISDYITPKFLSQAEKKNVRSLSASETEVLENQKFKVLSNMIPYQDTSSENIEKLLQVEDINANVYTMTNAAISLFVNQRQRQPTTDEMRKIQSYGFASAFHEESVCDSNNILGDIQEIS